MMASFFAKTAKQMLCTDLKDAAISNPKSQDQRIPRFSVPFSFLSFKAIIKMMRIFSITLRRFAKFIHKFEIYKIAGKFKLNL